MSEYNVPPFWQISHFFYTNLVEDVEILLTVRFVEFHSAVPVKFRWIPFSGFRGEVEYVSANQKLGRPSCFSDRPEKHKLGRGHQDLASYQVLFYSVQQIQRRSRKCLSRSEARAAILFFRSAWKTQTSERTLRSCFLSSFVEFRAAVSEEKSKMSQPIRSQGGHLVFQKPEKHKLGKSTLRSCFLSSFISFLFSGFRGEVENVSANQRPGRPSCFSDRPKNTNLIEDIEILLPVKFRWIPCSSFRREVKYVSANQRPGRPSCFSDRPEKHTLGRGRWDLASCQVSLNSVQPFQTRSRKCLSQSEARAAILFFRSARIHKLGRGRWDLASCQVSLNSVQRFQRRSRKCESLRRTDDGRTDDGRLAMTIAHSSLWLRWAKKARHNR